MGKLRIWVVIRIPLEWVRAVVRASQQQAIRDHADAERLSDPKIREEAEMQHEASEGFKAIVQRVENDRGPE